MTSIDISLVCPERKHVFGLLECSRRNPAQTRITSPASCWGHFSASSRMYVCLFTATFQRLFRIQLCLLYICPHPVINSCYNPGFIAPISSFNIPLLFSQDWGVRDWDWLMTVSYYPVAPIWWHIHKKLLTGHQTAWPPRLLVMALIVYSDVNTETNVTRCGEFSVSPCYNVVRSNFIII